jgi:hypothetical protein
LDKLLATGSSSHSRRCNFPFGKRFRGTASSTRCKILNPHDFIQPGPSTTSSKDRFTQFDFRSALIEFLFRNLIKISQHQADGCPRSAEHGNACVDDPSFGIFEDTMSQWRFYGLFFNGDVFTTLKKHILPRNSSTKLLISKSYCSLFHIIRKSH